MTSPDDSTGKRIDYTRPQPGEGPAPTGPQPNPGSTTPPPPAPVRSGVAWTTYAVTIVAFILILAVVVFITQNTYPVSIKFLGWTHHASVAGALAGAAAVGFIAGLLIGLVPQLRLRRELRSLRKAVR